MGHPSKSRAVRLLAALVATASMIPDAARADCVDGVRDATPAELEFATRARAALIAGIPTAVAPIERRGRPNDPAERVSLNFCRGTPLGAFVPGVQDGFSYSFGRDEAAQRSAQRRELLRQIEELERLPPDKEAQRKALEDQMKAAYAAAPRRSRSDPPLSPDQQALADRQNAEGRRLEQAARQVESEHRAAVRAQTDPLRARADELQQGPQLFTVRLQMNVERFPAANEGGPGVALTFGSPSPKRSAALLPQNIIVLVDGPDSPARAALVNAIDKAYLQSLIGQPTPDVSASRARIEKTNAQAASIAPQSPAAVSSSASSSNASSSNAAAATPQAPVGGVTRSASTAIPPCPPARSASASEGARTGSQVGADVGGATLGGGWGRGVGSSIGGVLGAIAGGAKKQEPAPADCPQ